MDASAPPNQRRAYWLKALHQWHWVSSALALVGMLLFAVTGITLNHASQIEAKPAVSTRQTRLPAELMAAVARPTGADGEADRAAALPPALAAWLAAELQLEVPLPAAEWSAGELYLALPRPGGDAWLRIDRASGALEYERTDRGWISYLNDLHKGRHTGTAWSWFIDIFSVGCVVFTLTGLFILKMHAANRPTTWPIVVLGLVAPLLIALLAIH